MEPILNKEEIADLISAIKKGKISTESVGYASPNSRRRLNAVDIDLFQAYEHIQGSGELRIPNLDIVIDSFARNFATSLTNTLQRSFSVEREEITTTDFQQSLQNLNSQGAVGIYNIAPLKNSCLFHFDTSLAFTLLEIMLGSSHSSESIAFDRNLTTIEIAILKTMMMEICDDLQKAMRPIADLQASLTKVENNFRLVNIVEAETEVLVTKFKIRISGELCGTMRFIIPYLTLEPLRENFKELVSIAQATAYNWAKIFAREALEMESTVIARSGLINMTIRNILNLQVGDIVDLQYNPDHPLAIMVEEHPLFSAIPGERNGKKAIHVTGRYSKRLGGIHGSN
jgi:flagellar motor switch protein FliM